MRGAAQRGPSLALLVEQRRVLERVRVELRDGVEAGPALVQRGDPRDVGAASSTEVSLPSSIIFSAVGPSSVSRSRTGSAWAGAAATSSPASAQTSATRRGQGEASLWMTPFWGVRDP